MLLSALVGLACAALGLLSLLVDLSGTLALRLGGAAISTPAQKVAFLALGLAMAGLGTCGSLVFGVVFRKGGGA
jgi:hypothetical protein